MASELGGLTDLMTFIRDVRNQAASSVTSYTRDTGVVSRMYIEQQLANEDIIVPLISTLHQMYIGYILTALGLSNVVSGSKTVRDVLQLVSTESYMDATLIMNKDFGIGSRMGMEADGAKMVDLDPQSQRLVAGKLIEFDMITGSYQGKPSIVKANIYVQLVPYVVQTEVIGAFASLNFTLDKSKRWAQYKAGEISLVKDYIMAGDLVAKHREALKADKSGVLAEMINRQHAGAAKYIMSLAGLTPENHNSASSIMIADKSTFERACHDAGINFHNVGERQGFFNKSFMMMVVLVDPMYNKIDLYLNGIQTRGEYTYNMINKVGKGKDADIKDMMAMFGQGSVPKF